MEVESGGDSGAAGSSGQGGIDGAESRGDMVEGESYAEEDDELMLEYMENEGVGSEEIDRFMGWTTMDLRYERLEQARRAGPSVDRRTGLEERGASGRGFKLRKDQKRDVYSDKRGGGGGTEA